MKAKIQLTLFIIIINNLQLFSMIPLPNDQNEPSEFMLRISFRQRLVNSEIKDGKDFFYIRYSIQSTQSKESLRQELKLLLWGVINRSAKGYLNLPVEPGTYPSQPSKKSVSTFEQLNALVKLKYQIKGNRCMVYFSYLSLQPIEDKIKKFVQNELIRYSNKKLGFSLNQQKLNSLKCIKQSLQEELNQSFQLMDQIFKQFYLAYNDLKQERHQMIELLENKNDTYPDYSKYDTHQWYKLMKDVFMRDHCFFNQISQFFHEIHTEEEGIYYSKCLKKT